MNFGGGDARLPTNIARTKNMQKLEKKLSKRRHCTAESRNSLEPLVRSSLNRNTSR